MISFDKQTMDNLIKVVKIHGSTINTLEMNYDQAESSEYQVDADDLRTFLENISNITEWKIDVDADIFSDIIGSGQPVLFKLKRHIEVASYPLSDSLFEKLDSFIGSDTVEHLDLDQKIVLEKFVLRQRNVKSVMWLSFMLDRCQNIYQNLKILKLEELVCFAYDDDDSVNRCIFQIFRENKDLRKITFTAVKYLSASIVDEICHKSLLQFLSIEISDDNAINLMGISRLKELQEIEITFFKFTREDLLDELTKLKMPSIKKTTFHKTDDVYIDFDSIMENLGRHWKNIEEFTVDLEYYKAINSILKNLHNLKTLTIYYKSWNINRSIFEYDTSIYSSLQRLTILKNGSTSFDFPIYFLRALPNLSCLIVRTQCDFKDVPQINVQMPKLKTLKLSFNVVSSEILPTLSDVKAIKELCRSLKEFEIKFSTVKKSNFTHQLQTLLENEDYIKQEYRAGQRKFLVLKNFKY